MTSLFSKPKAPKKSAEQAQYEQDLIKQNKRLKAEEDARKRIRKGGPRKGGRVSLIATSEKGIEDEKKSSLGG